MNQTLDTRARSVQDQIVNGVLSTSKNRAILVGLLLALSFFRSGSLDAHPAQRSPEPTATATYSAYPDLSSPNCYKAKDHNVADLCAQFRAAIAAEEAVHEARRATTWSIVGTLLSAIALLSLVETIRQGRKGLAKAEDSNRVARAEFEASRRDAAAAESASAAALDASRASEERQTRAYVFVESITLGVANQGPNKGVAGAVIVVRNTGRTPAFDVRHYCEVRLLPVDEEALLSLPRELERKSETDVPMAGSINAVRHLPRRLNRAEAAAIRAGTMAIFAHGKIEYTDAFGKARQTSYRNFYCGVWPPIGTPGMNFYDAGNETD